MPLLPDGLEDDLETLFASPPSPNTASACATEWADAIETYAAGVLPASSQVSTAAATLQGALVTAFGNVTAAATAAAMEAAFAAFAVTVGAGMAPAFTATPPPSPVGFAALFAAEHPATHAAAATDWKNAIDGWMTTGTATPSGGGAPINWN